MKYHMILPLLKTKQKVKTWRRAVITKSAMISIIIIAALLSSYQYHSLYLTTRAYKIPTSSRSTDTYTGAHKTFVMKENGVEWSPFRSVNGGYPFCHSSIPRIPLCVLDFFFFFFFVFLPRIVAQSLKKERKTDVHRQLLSSVQTRSTHVSGIYRIYLCGCWRVGSQNSTLLLDLPYSLSWKR